MAKPSLFDFDVQGLDALKSNLAEFVGPEMLGKIVRFSLAAGAAIPLQRARINARGLGLGYMGERTRRNIHGANRGTVRRYGRIPRSLKAGRAYIPKAVGPSVYRLNVIARSQQWPGVYRNKAPHAHLIEYGWVHKGGGRIPGREFMGPALTATAQQTVDRVAERMRGLVNALKFPNTIGRGKR